ncbi:hypothetical protein [Belnapia arida]|nr:hypothetical protein [Belnapia arida]
MTPLTLDIVEAILNGLAPVGLGLTQLLEPFELEWEQQRRGFAV